MRMVMLTGKCSFLAASCCRVEVVNGGAGCLTASFFSISDTLNTASALSSRNFLASSTVSNLLSRVPLTFVPAVPNMPSTL